MAQFIENIQYRIKSGSSSVGLLSFKLVSGLVLSLTISLIVDEIFRSGSFAFVLVMVTALTAFFRVCRGWNWAGIVIFDLICVLFGLLLRMYILMAPGS